MGKSRACRTTTLQVPWGLSRPITQTSGAPRFLDFDIFFAFVPENEQSFMVNFLCFPGPSLYKGAQAQGWVIV